MIRLAFVLLLALCGLVYRASEVSAVLTVEEGRVEKVTIEAKKCAPNDVPDVPARVFVDELGRVQMVAGQTETWRWVGDNLDELEKDCGRSVFKSDNNPDWRMFNDYEWLASTYTLDGKRIFGLAHNEYHGWSHNDCNYGDESEYWKCWYNSLSGVISVDGGVSYGHAAAPGQMLLRSPFDYDKGRVGGNFSGFFEPSNIIRRGDYYYALVMSLNNGGENGACLMRTTDLADAGGWRLWNGNDFALALPEAGKCQPVILHASMLADLKVASPHYSLIYNEYLGKYAAVECGADVGCFYALSGDLVNWEGRERMFDRGGRSYCNYATLIQPGDESRNFEVTGRSPWMYFSSNGSRSSCDMGPGGTDEALYRVRLRLNKKKDEGKYELLDLRFGERRGEKTLDSSFYGNNGQLIGDARFLNDGGRNFISFGGQGAVEVAGSENLGVRGSFTIEAELRLRGVLKEGFPTIIRKEEIGKRNYGLYLNDEGKLHFSFQNGQGEVAGSAAETGLADGNWHKVAVVVEEGTVIYVVDGRTDGMFSYPDLTIGGQNTAAVRIGDQGFVGDIDNLRLLNYAKIFDQKAVTGDFDGDGEVGLADLWVWKKEYLGGRMVMTDLWTWKSEYVKSRQ